MFKVAADFDDDVKRDPETVESYARLIAQHAKALQLSPLSRAAVQRVIEQRARQADDGEKLSMDMRSLDDLLLRRLGPGALDLRLVWERTPRVAHTLARLLEWSAGDESHAVGEMRAGLAGDLAAAGAPLPE